MTDVASLAPAARNYPASWAELRMLADGRPLLIRPTTAGDGDLLQEFVRGLSVPSRYQRFQGAIRELAPTVLENLLGVDYDRKMAFAAVLSEHGQQRMIGEARYAPALVVQNDKPALLTFSDLVQVTDVSAHTAYLPDREGDRHYARVRLTWRALRDGPLNTAFGISVLGRLPFIR